MRLVVAHHYEQCTVKLLANFLDSPHDGCSFKLDGAPVFLIFKRGSAQNNLSDESFRRSGSVLPPHLARPWTRL